MTTLHSSTFEESRAAAKRIAAEYKMTVPCRKRDGGIDVIVPGHLPLDIDSFFEFIRKNADEAAIIAAMAAVAQRGMTDLSDQELMVLSALKRANPSLADFSITDIQAYLSNLEENQISGLVSSTKGVLHEMEFVRMENEDGDSIYAAMHGDPNHHDTDVVVVDKSTGKTTEVQLKATDDASYVDEWIAAHPNGEIMVTSELADETGLPSSGISNEWATASVSDFVDKMLSFDAGSGLWDYFPALSIASVSVVVFELWERYKRGEIDKQTFQETVALTTGLKVAKIAAIVFLLTVPIVGQITGAVLIAKILLGAKDTWFDRPHQYKRV